MRPLYALLPLLVVACDPSVERMEAGHRRASLDAELAGREASPPVDCIDSDVGRSLDVVDASTLVLRTPRVVYVNRLEGACPGLRPTSLILIEPADAHHYCRLDRIRSVDPGSSVPRSICPLGRFTAYARR